MIAIYKKTGDELVQLQKPEQDCWINIYPPYSKDDIQQLSEELKIPLDYFIDSLDPDERSRYEIEDGVKLIVLNVPILNEVDKDDDSFYVTIPIGIVITADMIITISSFDNKVVETFLERKVKNFDPSSRGRFALQIFDRAVFYYLYYLKQINHQRNLFEKEMYSSSRNRELTKLVSLQKGLVYFVNDLRANELLMMKIKRTNFLQTADKEEELEFFEDIIVDNSQALDVANVYTNILTSTMDAFASIISNNLNIVLKRLTSVTIVLMVPTLVASLFGMNVDLPLQHKPYAFVFTILLAFILSIGVIWFFTRKRWF